jgi:hypothetical protein
VAHLALVHFTRRAIATTFAAFYAKKMGRFSKVVRNEPKFAGRWLKITCSAAMSKLMPQK